MGLMVGIDIGTYLTKIIEVKSGLGAYEVVNLKYFRTPLLKDGEIDFNVFFKNLDGIIPLARLRMSHVGISLPSSSANFTHFDFPKLPKNELSKALLAEAHKKILPAPGPQDNVKYMIVEESKVKTGSQLRVFAGSVEKAVSDKFYIAFKTRGIIPQFVGSSETSMYAVFLEFFASLGKNWAFINVGYKHTTIVIFVRGMIAFVRNVPFAGQDIVSGLSKQLKSDAETVLQMLRNNQCEEPLLTGQWQSLLAEIRRSFAYFKSIAPSDDVTHLLLCGGFIQLDSLRAFLKGNLRGEISVFDLAGVKRLTCKNVAADELTGMSPFFVNSLGLAVGTHISQPLINFLPEEVFQKKKTEQVQGVFVKILGLSAIVLLLALVGVNILVFYSNRRAFPPVRQEMVRLKYESLKKQVDEVRVKQGQLVQQIGFVDGIKRFDLPLAAVYTAIDSSIPDAIYLQNVRIEFLDKAPADQNFIVVMQGVVFNDYESAVKEVQEFRGKLEKTGLFIELRNTPIPLEEIVLKPDKPGQTLTMIQKRPFAIEAKIKKP